MGAQWPYVTLPDFEKRASNLRKQTSAVGVVVAPIVQQEQTSNWTNYVLANGAWVGTQFNPYIFVFSSQLAGAEEGESSIQLGGPMPAWPIWQIDPLPIFPVINFNAHGYPSIVDLVQASYELGEGVATDVLPTNVLASVFPTVSNVSATVDEPHSTFIGPIFDTLDEATRKPVGQILVFLRWNLYFANKLPEDVNGIHLVLDNTCGRSVTWELRGKDAVFLGRGDLHDTSYDKYKVSSPFNFYKDKVRAASLGICLFTINLYPTSTFEDEYKTTTPVGITVLVGAVFVSMVVAFLAYDAFQRRRTTKVVVNAARSNQLLTSLFPSNIRDRLLESEPKEETKSKSGGSKSTFLNNNKGQLKSFLDDHNVDDTGLPLNEFSGTKPIADLFLETTIMFADITGFTAWSSVREPSQVFTLLESVFSALDRMAKKRRVFKVETVGDCYVAVAGLPEPRRDHALVMARFARDTLRTVQEMVKRLELSLGPDTGDLGVRIGLHSGVGKFSPKKTEL
mmetsp:Transcript_86/g.218  ORF Transcript_86/g.218 Transcript_86/m.218 type:complete len:510 (-) Transcript_86:1595-3124(-)